MHTLTARFKAKWAEQHLGLGAGLGDALAILGVVGPHAVHLV